MQIPLDSVRTPLPHISAEADGQAWQPDVNWTAAQSGSSRSSTTSQAGILSTLAHQLAKLARICNSTLSLFYAPSSPISGRRLALEYQKYLTWQSDLPANAAVSDHAPPHILVMHMWFHCSVLLLFRPFMRAKITDSDIDPFSVCRSSANSISEIYAGYQELYDSEGLHVLPVQCLLSACTIHVLNIHAYPDSFSHLMQTLDLCNKIKGRQPWANAVFHVIRNLAEEMNVELPQEALDLLNDQSEAEAWVLTDRTSSLYRPTKELFLNPGTRIYPSEGSDTIAAAIRDRIGDYLFLPFPNQPQPWLEPVANDSDDQLEDSPLDVGDIQTQFEGLRLKIPTHDSPIHRTTGSIDRPYRMQ